MQRSLPTWIATFLLLAAALVGQEARLRPTEAMRFPAATDGTTPSFWWKGELRLFSSIGWPLQISLVDPATGEWRTQRVNAPDFATRTLWVEAVWVDEDDTVFAWYHHEPGGLYEDSMLTAPKIGALVSFDGGLTVHDLGFVLESGDPLQDGAQNGFFTGGHGDFSVVPDRDRGYFYFFFTNYGGAAETQGVAMARMKFSDRYEPAGKVQKFHDGEWLEPGVAGRLTALFPARRAWEHPDPDSFWGPAVHWNSYLNCYVMLLNRAQGEPGWAQEGVYISFSSHLADPAAWSRPVKILGGNDIPAWSSFYPQVFGQDAGGTDTQVGQIGRFFLNGTSAYEIEFVRPPEPPPPSSDEYE